MARFFISHAARHDEPDSEAVRALTEAVRLLEADEHVVFVDQKMPPYAAWRSRLYHELGICNAALILLDERALTRPWVRREVDILLWRRCLLQWRYRGMDVFPIAVVRLDGVSSERLREFSPELHDLQTPEVPPHPADELSAADRLRAAVEAAVELARGLPGRPLDDPLANWLTNLATHLSHVEPPATLEVFAGRLGVDDPEAVTADPRQADLVLAHQLIGRAEGRRLIHALHAVKAPLLGERTAELAKLAAPALVDPATARMLLPADGDCPPPVFALNSTSGEVARRYVERAMCADESGFRFGQTDATIFGESLDELPQLMLEEVMRVCNVRSRGYLIEWGEADRRTGNPVYLAVRTRQADLPAVREAVRSFQKEYRWVMIIIVVGAATGDPVEPPVEPDDHWVGIVELLPRLTREQERSIEDLFHTFVPDAARAS